MEGGLGLDGLTLELARPSPRLGLDPSALKKLWRDLSSPAGLFTPMDAEFESSGLLRQIGRFAWQRSIATSAGLAGRDVGAMSFWGGVCALSTRESTLARLGILETQDRALPIKTLNSATTNVALWEMAETVTAVQVFETVGLTPLDTALVAEDELWASRVTEFLAPYYNGSREGLERNVSHCIRRRNAVAVDALDRLRTFLYGSEAEPVRVISDTDLLTELQQRTDEMFRALDLPIDPSPYRFVYAGMYSYVWREVLIEVGIEPGDKTTVIFEPSKHFLPEDRAEIAEFRRQIKLREPYLQAGSRNEQVGFIAYREPTYSNGVRLLRDTLPTALQPNSSNFESFDFGEFPICPKAVNRQPQREDFRFLRDLGSLKLDQNPAYCWSRVFPPTRRIDEIVQRMQQVKANSRTANAALNPGTPPGERALSQRAYSEEMKYLAEDLIGELRQMTTAMFAPYGSAS